MTLSELRDVILVIAVAGLGLVALGYLALILIAGRIGWRAVRGAQRLHDERVASFLERLDGLVKQATHEDGSLNWQALRPAAQSALARVRPRKKRKRRRLWGLLPPAG